MGAFIRMRAAIIYLCIFGTVLLWQCDVKAGDVRAGVESRPPAEPHDSLSCTQCHPENGKTSMKDTKKFCVKCHEASTDENSHPTGIPSGAESPKDLPLSEDGRIECYTCHIMHEDESAAPKLLRKDFNSLCTSCHLGSNAEYPRSGNPQPESH